MSSGGIVICPRCKPLGTKVTRLDGRRLGWSPEALYVGYRITRFSKKPPPTCPVCGTRLEVTDDSRHRPQGRVP